jgi:phosphomevalonate kinase
VPGDSSNLVVSAPGKLMVSGEYAVLDGASAIVAAVDRRAFAQVDSNGSAEPPAEARAAFAQAERQFGEPSRRSLSIDVSSLRAEGAKLGLGSSAAAAAAAAGWVFAEHDCDLRSSSTRARIFESALRGHREISPQGSGADVAAAVHGGFLRFRTHGDSVETEAVEWPSTLRARVVWTQQEARTSRFLESVSSLGQAKPEIHRQLMAGLAREAERFADALAAKDVPSLLASTQAYGRAMGELGHAAGIPIVTDTLRQIAELASAAGGAAKPSGAGGGDVALALFPDSASDQRFENICREKNFTVLLIELGAPGVSLEGALHGTR